MIEIGNNHRYKEVMYKGSLTGINVLHNNKDNKECIGGFVCFTGSEWDKEFDGKLDTWEIIDEKPLTLSPSILCRLCGDHGFITDGKWVVS